MMMVMMMMMMMMVVLMMMMSMIINLDAKFGGGRFEKRKPSLEFGGEMGEGGMVKEKNKKTSTPSLEEVERLELEDDDDGDLEK